MPNRNAINVIHPCKYHGTWVFDDEERGLLKEAFVAGADDIIDEMVTSIPNAEDGFTLLFSAGPFPGHNLEVQRREPEGGGYHYYSPALDRTGWLCPALFEYFEEAPESVYAQFKEGCFGVARGEDAPG